MSDKREWTAERHAAAWDRCNRATSGPWKWWTSNSHRRLTAEDRQDGGVAYGTKHKDGCGDIVIGEHDMALIEEARLDLPDALREIERQREQVEALRGEMDLVRSTLRLERAEVDRLKADLLLLGALKSAEVAPVIERFREAFGADVPRAPIGKRAEAERDAWERLRSAATAAVEAYENSDADETFEPVFESLDDALAGLATFEEESGDGGEPAKVDTPVRHARHDRHCMIGDGGGCSHEPGCEVEE